MNRNGFKVIDIKPELIIQMRRFIKKKLNLLNAQKLNEERYFNKFFSTKIKRSFSLQIENLAIKEAYRIAQKYFKMTGVIPYVDKELIKKCKYPKLDLFFRIVRKNKISDIGYPHTDKFFWNFAKKNNTTPPFSDCKKRVKVWIPLIGCSKQNSLIVYSGSHKKKNDYFLVKNNKNYSKPILKGELNKKKYIVPIFCEKNKSKALLFDDNLIHAGQINRTSKYRISAEFHIIMDN